MRAIYVTLPDPAVMALRALAEREFRGPKEQAAVLILDGLKRAGLDGEQPAAPAEEPRAARTHR